MIRRSIAHDMRQRRVVGDPPMVLLLGAGASVESGIGAMHELIAHFGCRDFEAFYEYVRTQNASERYRQLAQFLQNHSPAAVTEGYRTLARLCADLYIDTVLTTNLDPLLDEGGQAPRRLVPQVHGMDAGGNGTLHDRYPPLIE